MRNIFRILLSTVILVSFVSIFVACGSDSPPPQESSTVKPQDSASDKGQDNKPVVGPDTGVEEKIIKIGFCQDFYPTVFLSEDGKADGYDISVFKAIDERLPEYKFEFEGVSQESVLIGLDSGVYEVGLSGFFKNPEREEKYLYPKRNLGGNHLSLVTRKDTTDVKTFADLTAKGLKLAPLAPSTGTYTIAKQYNIDHPDAQVDFEANEQADDTTKYQWLLDGRYGAVFDITEFVNWKTDALKITDQVVVNEPFSAIPTYPLFRKDQTELAAAYDRVMEELKNEGVLSELSTQWFKSDVHKYFQ
jgi:L-cystine transport system substrate-binding protein